MQKKEYLIALGFLTLLILVGVATSPILKNEKWWIRWWVCEYEDGTLVYHRLRPERTWQNSVNYFNGKHFDGTTVGKCDNDAFMVIDDIEHYVCYDSAGAADMKKIHGPIMSVRRQTPPPHRPPSASGRGN